MSEASRARLGARDCTELTSHHEVEEDGNEEGDADQRWAYEVVWTHVKC